MEASATITREKDVRGAPKHGGRFASHVRPAAAEGLLSDTAGDVPAFIGASRALRASRELGIDPVELTEHVRDGVTRMLNRSAVAVQIRDDLVLSDILDRGRLISAFEVDEMDDRRSDGYLEHRAKMEELWFQIPAEQREGRPVYAALVNPVGRSDDMATISSTYGNIQLILHHGVKDRVTLTLGDSLDEQDVFPFIPGENPFQGVPDRHLMEIAEHDFDRDRFRFIRYVEAQVHGGVTVDDIQEIRVPDWYYVDEDVLARAEYQGITVVREPGD